MANLTRVRIPMPSAGMNTIAGPGQAPDGKGPIVRNFLPSFPGKMVMRGPIDGQFFTGSTKIYSGVEKMMPMGCAVFNDRVFLTYGEAGLGKKYLPAWKQPYLKGANIESVMTPTLGVYIDTTTGEISKAELPVEAFPGHSYAALEGQTYYVAAFRENYVNNQNGTRQATPYMYKWNGSLEGVEKLTEAPVGAQFVKSYLNRLWVLGGSEPGLGTAGVWKKYGGRIEATSGQSYFYAYGLKADIEEFFDVGMSIKIAGVNNAETTFVSIAEAGVHKFKVTVTGSWASTVSGTYKLEGQTAGIEPNTLWFSEAGGPTENNKTKWRSPTTGLINRIIVGTNDQRDFGVALAVVGQTLIVFKRNSIWALYGTSPESFQIRNLTYEFGCVDPNSVLESSLGVYFASQKGLMYFNGESFNTIDDEIKNVTCPLIEQVAGTAQSQLALAYYGSVHMTDIGNGYMMLTIAKQKHEAENKGTAIASFSALMHHESGNWSEFSAGSGGIGGTGVPLMVSKVNNQPFMYDGEFITDLSHIATTNPAELTNRDSVRTATAIPAKLSTDRIALSSPGYTTQLHRLMQDYTFPNGANDALATAGWYWTLVNGDGTVVQEPVQLPGTGALTTKFQNGRRWELDNFNEIIDGRIRIEWKESSLQVKNPELYDATLEFDSARQRRST